MNKEKTIRQKVRIPQKIFAAEFTLAIGCKLNCKYCPQEKLIHNYTTRFGSEKLFMSFEDFKLCLSKIERGAGIAIGGMVEAFHNRECAKMIKYAYEQGYKIGLDTSLEGVTEDDYELLKEVNFQHLQLHIPDKEGNSKFHITKQYLSIFDKFNERFDVTGYSCHGQVHDAIKPYIKSEILFGNEMMNRAGNLDYSDLKTYSHRGALVCGSGSLEQRGGWLPEILPNGTVLLCCMDYGMDHILGNILKQEWDEIFEGQEYLNFEKGLDDETTPLLCRHCPVALQKENAPHRLNLLGAHAIKVARLMKDFESGTINIGDSELEHILGKSQVDVVRRIVEAENICIFGLGKLFEDNYFNSLWYNVIPADVFSDNNKEKWGHTIRNIPCVPPEQLIKIQNLLVITYVTDDREIRKVLKPLGLHTIINIYDIFNLDF